MSKSLGPNLSRGQTCLEAGLVPKTLRPDLSKNLQAGLVQKLRGRTCPKRFRAGLVSRPDLSKHFEARLVQTLRGRTCPSTLGPDLSRGWTCPRTLRPDLSQHFEAGLVQNTLGLDLSKTLQGWTCLEARLVPCYYRAGLVQKLWGRK